MLGVEKRLGISAEELREQIVAVALDHAKVKHRSLRHSGSVSHAGGRPG